VTPLYNDDINVVFEASSWDTEANFLWPSPWPQDQWIFLEGPGLALALAPRAAVTG